MHTINKKQKKGRYVICLIMVHLANMLKIHECTIDI